MIDDGLKLVVTRLPCPEAEKEMAELNPPVTAVLIVTFPDVPRVDADGVGESR